MHQKLIPDPFLILVNNPKQPLHARNSFTNQIFWKRIYKKLLKSQLYFSSEPHVIVMSLICHSNTTCIYLHVIPMSLECTCMSAVCHLYVLVCNLYVTCMYSHVICMSLHMYSYVICISPACTCMSSIFRSYVLACH